ncbi:hypothetical protein MP478_01830 [Chryseobacterium sp. WG14]|uniref:hypothetical protein n=1 Tax=Chryseobacterium sp. WG14 TaxID=2926909 RepID=UPI00211DEDE3|nr:hypothetical protein [Chryseobacterium sp. WG14]MCQ9638113.1 hypothetical protein [Chryseobacterium sp. WG14]
MRVLKSILDFFEKNYLRIITFEICFIITFLILFSYSKAENFNKKEILSLLISAGCIIIAIMVTYLFSKLFTEKTIRIERKKEIDEYAIKITRLRSIAYHILGMHEFWKFRDANIKSAVDYHYPDLTYEEYRSYDLPGIRKFSYDEHEEMSSKIYGTNGQSYLALKGLTDREDNFSFYAEVNPQNYSLETIIRYTEYCNSFWYLLENSDDNIVNFNKVHEYWLEPVIESTSRILGKKIKKEKLKEELKNLMVLFTTSIFEKHYYLTKLNSDFFPTIFKQSLLNILIFVIIVILSLFVFIIEFSSHFNHFLTLIIVALFIANTIDLILLTIKSIRRELEVTEIFRI